ncbi:MAG TPA: nuclear transport factor 2 family protein, partial [Steroidobacteraceae bacterium]|nr:nuclear transport factor 2 family protein [Steroidobacteraceae bacterium]
AITQELIPHLEKTFRLAAQPSARIVEGASTGGWEALALQLHYPDFFGGAWVFNPDPIDFTRYALSDVYKDENFFSTEVTPWVSAERSMLRNREGQVTWTARQVAQFEAVLGTKGRSNYQLDIWQATHGPVGADGYPALLFDKKTGVIDRKVADYMRERGFDLTEYTRRNWATLGPKLSGKLHFFSGEQDEFFLNLGVYKFEEMLAQMDNPRADASFAYGRPKKGHNWHLTDFAQMVRDMAAHVASSAAPSVPSVPVDASPAVLAQRQLAAYNARDLEAFLAVYSDDVEIHAFPGRLLYKGKDRMRERYAKLFAESPRLHCELVHRTVHGNVVIDQERVTGVRGDGVIEASAVYTIAGGRIARVDFVQ